jgi:hypothetical protein
MGQGKCPSNPPDNSNSCKQSTNNNYTRPTENPDVAIPQFFANSPVDRKIAKFGIYCKIKANKHLHQPLDLFQFHILYRMVVSY